MTNTITPQVPAGYMCKVEVQAPNGIWYERERVNGSIVGMNIRTRVVKIDVVGRVGI